MRFLNNFKDWITTIKPIISYRDRFCNLELISKQDSINKEFENFLSPRWHQFWGKNTCPAQLNTRTFCSTRLIRYQIFSSVKHMGYVCYTQFNHGDMLLCVLLVYTWLFFLHFHRPNVLAFLRWGRYLLFQWVWLQTRGRNKGVFFTKKRKKKNLQNRGLMRLIWKGKSFRNMGLKICIFMYSRAWLAHPLRWLPLACQENVAFPILRPLAHWLMKNTHSWNFSELFPQWTSLQWNRVPFLPVIYPIVRCNWKCFTRKGISD